MYFPPSPSSRSVPQSVLVPMHSARDGYLGGHRDDLEKAFFAETFFCQGRRVCPSGDACSQLVDQVVASLSEAPKAFHRECGEFIAALVEGHLFWSSVVAAFARFRFVSRQPVSVSAACAYVAHRLRICVRDVEQYRLVAILR